MQWTRKDLLSIYDLSAEEITCILDTAEKFKEVSERRVKKVPALRGMTVVNFFVEPSTRTRVSFELAEQRLSADIVNMQAQASSLLKGETLLDTVKNIEALQVDLVVMRHSATGAQNFIADRLKCGVINAGDGAHEHPTQGLLDLFTIREKKGGFLRLCEDSLTGEIHIAGFLNDTARSRIGVLRVRSCAPLKAERILKHEIDILDAAVVEVVEHDRAHTDSLCDLILIGEIGVLFVHDLINLFD